MGLKFGMQKFLKVYGRECCLGIFIKLCHLQQPCKVGCEAPFHLWHRNRRDQCSMYLFCYDIKSGVRDVSVDVMLMCTSLNILRYVNSVKVFKRWPSLCLTSFSRSTCMVSFQNTLGISLFYTVSSSTTNALFKYRIVKLLPTSIIHVLFMYLRRNYVL